MFIEAEKQQAETPRQFGYDFELGRYDAQNSTPGAELAESIRRLIQPLEELNRLQGSLDGLKRKLQAAQSELSKHRGSWYMKMLLPAPLVLFLSVELAGIQIFPALVFSISVMAFIWWKHSHLEKKLEAKAASCESEYQSAQNNIKLLLETYDFSLVPEAYRKREDMYYFVQVLSSGRAVSLREAITLYEDDKHKKEMLRLRKEQLRLQEEQINMQHRQLQEEKRFHDQQLAQAQEKKNVDWGSVAAAAGSVAIAALTIMGKKKKW